MNNPLQNLVNKMMQPKSRTAGHDYLQQVMAGNRRKQQQHVALEEAAA